MKEPTPQPAEESRLPLIDLARAASIVMVLAVHLAYGRLYNFPKVTFSALSWLCFARNGGYGVSLFFLISGFLITRMLVGPQEDYARIDLRAFYVRRIGRIVPLLLLMLMAGLFFLSLPAKSARMLFCFRSYPPTLGMALSIPTFTFNWVREWHMALGHYFGVHWDLLWSLSVEEQFYLFYPLLLRLTRTAGRTLLVLSGAVLLGPVARCVPHWLPAWPIVSAISHSFASFDLIAMGCLLFYADRFLSDRADPSTTTRQLLMAAGIVLAGAVYLTPQRSERQLVYLPTLLDAGFFLFLLGGLGLPWRPTAFIKAISWPGRLSYGIYLLHVIVLFVFWDLFRVSSPWASLSLFIVLNTAVAWMSFRFYEKPLNRWIRARYSKNR